MLIHPYTSLTFEQCQKARMSRDSRFDGRFYIGVKTTGIFCRPICPANLPKEENVEYFTDKTQAIKAGYRPCLRCRPDSLGHRILIARRGFWLQVFCGWQPVSPASLHLFSHLRG